MAENTEEVVFKFGRLADTHEASGLGRIVVTEKLDTAGGTGSGVTASAVATDGTESGRGPRAAGVKTQNASQSIYIHPLGPFESKEEVARASRSWKVRVLAALEGKCTFRGKGTAGIPKAAVIICPV